MSNIPEQILDKFYNSIERRIDSSEMNECVRCIVVFMVEQGFIKACKIRAYMVGQLYPKALAETPSKTQAIKTVARWMEIDEKQVRNILSNRTRY
jgi:hypothetical protein